MELSLPTTRFTQSLARVILRLLSWRLEVTPPPASKYVLVGAPHTSGWDLLFFLLMAHGAGIKVNWVGKDTLFRWPVGGLLRWLGGIPVNRHARTNFVQQIVDVFNRLEELVITIAPEGTRGRAAKWKTGFYYIALGARVPIVLGFIDYREKIIGIGPSMMPTGDIQADFVHIKEFYSGKTGRQPEQQGEILI